MFSYGAKKFDCLHEAIKTSILWSTGFCVIFGFTIAIFPTQIMSLFTEGDMEMIRVGSIALRANGLSFMLFGFYTVYSFLFLVMGKAKEGCIIGACRQGICFIPVMLILPMALGLNGILYAQPSRCPFCRDYCSYGIASSQGAECSQSKFCSGKDGAIEGQENIAAVSTHTDRGCICIRLRPPASSLQFWLFK